MDLRKFCNYIKSNIGRLNRDNYMKLQLLVSLSKMQIQGYILKIKTLQLLKFWSSLEFLDPQLIQCCSTLQLIVSL